MTTTAAADALRSVIAREAAQQARIIADLMPYERGSRLAAWAAAEARLSDIADRIATYDDEATAADELRREWTRWADNRYQIARERRRLELDAEARMVDGQAYDDYETALIALDAYRDMLDHLIPALIAASQTVQGVEW